MMSNKQYFKNIRSEAEDMYSNASGRRSGFRGQVGGEVEGCTMSSAENFNPSATEENGSCMWLTTYNGQWVSMQCRGWHPEVGYVDYTFGSDFIAVNQCALVNYGCLDPSADNYNPSADQDWTWGGTTLCEYASSGGSSGSGLVTNVLTSGKDPKGKGKRRGMRSATGDEGLNWSGAAINVVAVTALGAVVGALVSKKGKVQAAKVGGSIGFLLGFVGGFQVLKESGTTKA